ncbi:MAG: type I-U CRISPR-associated RAMP protein Csb1/Cas7u, partial [Propionibacteriaceae bacterium]|nr:type I-U CRISPR-associated RAMP protein Csb1/Cas7u [Propionibacteriaceae bacterium]
MSDQFSFDDLIAACSPGGASVLTVVTELAPAAGPHGAVAPAKYVRGNQAVYAYGRRFIDGEPQHVVTIDSKSSSLNRIESALADAILDGEEPLASMPRIQVSYADGPSYTDYQLPHRAFDGHIRAGMVDGVAVTQDPRYRNARDAKAANIRALMELSPVSPLLGSWDSTRKSNQSRFRSAMTGEIIGVLAVQSDDDPETPLMGGARVDPVAASVQLPGQVLKSLAEAQSGDLSGKLLDQIDKDIKKAEKGVASASRLGLGAIPPSLESLGLVSCRRIIRSTVLSFSALRQLRFGSPGEG